MQAVVKLLEQINSDELAFAYKLEYQRMYNLLMVCAVNDTQKTPDTCQLIAQGFNRVMNGPYDDYFENLGLPENWHESKEARTVTRADFQEQEN